MTIEELRESLEDISDEWGCEETYSFLKSKEFLNEFDITLKECVDLDMKKYGMIDSESISDEMHDIMLEKFKNGQLNKAINKYFKRNNIDIKFKTIFKHWLKITFDDFFWINDIDFDKIIQERFSKELKISEVSYKKVLLEQDFETEN